MLLWYIIFQERKRRRHEGGNRSPEYIFQTPKEDVLVQATRMERKPFTSIPGTKSLTSSLMLYLLWWLDRCLSISVVVRKTLSWILWLLLSNTKFTLFQERKNYDMISKFGKFSIFFFQKFKKSSPVYTFKRFEQQTRTAPKSIYPRLRPRLVTHSWQLTVLNLDIKPL